MKYLDLFSGIGGFARGIQDIAPDAECIGFSEVDKYAIQIYQKHFPNHKNYGDITKIKATELPNFDLICGGFPCQSFSIAGKRKGFADTRGTLFFDIARIIKEKRPKYLLLENVKGLVSHNGGKTLETILLVLQELGYYVNIEIHNAKDFGVPQNRERIFFLCKHIKTILNDGQTEITNISKEIIQQYLFQLLLNNVSEVKKLQERNLKDSVIGYLILKEINQNLKSSEKNIMDGIMMDTVGSIFQSREGEVWQNIDIWLSNNLGEELKQAKQSTILTAISKTIDLKTFTYSEMLKVILYAIVLWRESSRNSWNEMLSSLIIFKENTKYARINSETKTTIITEDGSAYLSKDFQEIRERVFIVGHLRGEPRPKVFPTGGDSEKTDELQGQHSNTLTARYYGGQANGTYIVESELNAQEIKQLNKPKHSNDRVYSPEGIGPTLNTMQGGRRQPFIQQRPRGNNKGGEHKIAPTVTGASYKDNNHVNAIRRLTPLGCERLQGFPDGWTEGVSNSQRYKCIGNAVTVNVIREIIKKII